MNQLKTWQKILLGVWKLNWKPQSAMAGRRHSNDYTHSSRMTWWMEAPDNEMDSSLFQGCFGSFEVKDWNIISRILRGMTESGIVAVTENLGVLPRPSVHGEVDSWVPSVYPFMPRMFSVQKKDISIAVRLIQLIGLFSLQYKTVALSPDRMCH